MYAKFADWTDSGGEPERVLTRDEMLDDISLYWLTNYATSSAQRYWENNANNFNAMDISLPAAVTIFPGKIYRSPRSWAERSYHSPEFAFEKDVDNVRRAAKDMRINYPIAIDNDHAIWRAFKNEYWPALYFVDTQGHIRHHRFGEG